jgi:gas vesicle protein GvpL/GvpF
MSLKKGTYVYCVIAGAKRPRLARARAGLPGTGPVRLLDAGAGLFVAVADAPLDRYGEAAINRGLGDLDWVSRAAVAHEAVVESFIAEAALLPMKLFTIFATDERALAYVRAEHRHISTVAKRVARHHEWGVRVVLDRARAVRARTSEHDRTRRSASAGDASSGVAYLTRKKAQRDAAAELAARARETVAALYDRLASRASTAKRKAASDLPVQGGPLLLDAAFLVPRSRAQSFNALVAREAKSLAPHGYGLHLTGPWPPYSFVQE